MDAVGLSNYAAAAGVSQQAKTAGATEKSEATRSTDSGTLLSAPIADTVEITTTPATETTTTPVAAFDPTATDGPYEQKHTGGALATSSAKDGFNGWEAMLKDYFGITGQGDRTDMAVIDHYDRYAGQYSRENGYRAANALTNEERNLVANLYVYAHDNGLSDSGAFKGLVNEMVRYAAEGHKVTFNNNFMEDLALMRTGLLPATAQRIADGMDVNRPEFATNSESVVDAVNSAVEILSSSAMDDSLLPVEHLSNMLGPAVQFYGTDEHAAAGERYFADLKQIVNAYSPSAAQGEVSVSSTPSVQAQKILDYHSDYVKYWDDAEAMAKTLSPSKFAGTGVPADLAALIGMNAEGFNIPGLPGANDADNMTVFDQFADRISYVVSSLGDDQKSTLGMLYKMAGESKGKLAKVDQLAGAMAAMNYMNKMVGDDNAMGTGNFWTQMLKQNQDQANEVLRDAIQKRLDRASVHVDTEA